MFTLKRHKYSNTLQVNETQCIWLAQATTATLALDCLFKNNFMAGAVTIAIIIEPHIKDFWLHYKLVEEWSRRDSSNPISSSPAWREWYLRDAKEMNPIVWLPEMCSSSPPDMLNEGIICGVISYIDLPRLQNSSL